MRLEQELPNFRPDPKLNAGRVLFMCILLLFFGSFAYGQDGSNMRYIKPLDLAPFDLGKWVHLDFGKESFALHQEQRSLDGVTITIDGKDVVFVEHRVDDGFTNWFEDQYLEAQEKIDGRTLRLTKSKLISFAGDYIKIEGHFDYFTPTGNPFLGRSFTKELSFPKSNIAEVLIYKSEYGDPREISLVPDNSASVGSIQLQFWDDRCKSGVKGVTISGTGPQKIDKAKADSDGIVILPGLIPGKYEIRAEKYGFKKLIVQDFQVIAGMQYRNTFWMYPGFADDDETPWMPGYDPCRHIDKPIKKFMHVG